MKRLPGTKDVDIPLTNGVLDARTPAGEGNVTDFRLLLNTSTWDERGKSRLPGWTARRSATPSNEDLHDQLLGAMPVAAQREAIVLLADVVSTYKTSYSIAATKSRIYASTGKGRNWRVLAYGLGGDVIDFDTWSTVQPRMAQMGEMLKKITTVTSNALAKNIALVVTPNAQVDQHEHIAEWLMNCDRKVFTQVRDHIINVKEEGELKPLAIKCNNCSHEYQQPFTLDMSNFFAAAS